MHRYLLSSSSHNNSLLLLSCKVCSGALQMSVGYQRILLESLYVPSLVVLFSAVACDYPKYEAAFLRADSCVPQLDNSEVYCHVDTWNDLWIVFVFMKSVSCQ